MRIGDTWVSGRRDREIRNPFRDETVCFAPESTAEEVHAAAAAAADARRVMAAMPAYERAALLRRAAGLVAERSEAIAAGMSREMGKAIRDARAEVARSQDTLLLAAEEAIRITGEHIPLDGSPMGNGKICMMLRFPVGVVAGITPFNAPFNLACHKVAPAIAAGNTLVLKAPPQAPMTDHRLIEIMIDAGAPPGTVNSLYGDRAGPLLVNDPRVDFISFTGSSAAGLKIKAASGFRRVALELGGTGSTIVEPDADLAFASGLCATNSMRLAGQSCISVQNVYVHQAVRDEFVARLRDSIGAMRFGDPLDERTDVGTVIDIAAAARIESWVSEAVEQGARNVLGDGVRIGASLPPILLVDVKPTMRIVREEVFGPIVNIVAYNHLDEALTSINDSIYGLQCGIFTKTIATALKVFRTIRAGGIIVNGTSTWRTDQLAYGGVKASGIGREGPRYAIRDMTEERFLLFNQ